MGLKFEDLPNELVLHLFQYLSAVDIFRCFSPLNRRYLILIRTIQPLHIDFSCQSLSKLELVSILNQIRSLNISSLRLSNQYNVDFISQFISYIPPRQLRHLRSLSLIHVDRSIVEKFLHNQLKLTSLSIESSTWRSFPQHILPHYPQLTHCHLSTLDFFHNCQSNLTHLTLDHCSTDNLPQLNIIVPNLRSLIVTLTSNTTIHPSTIFPSNLKSLKLNLRSFPYSEFEQLMSLIDHLETLSVSFTDTEHDLYSHDQYLLGQNWFPIQTKIVNLRLNIIVHQTFGTYDTSELLSNFNWYSSRLICQTLESSFSFHLFSLPFIDEHLTINQQISSHPQDFDSIHRLYLTSTNAQLFENYTFRNLHSLIIITSTINPSLFTFANHQLRTIDLRLTSTGNNCQDLFTKFISHLPSSIETLILNTTSTNYLVDLLDTNHDLLVYLKRLHCSVRTREQFDTLLLLLIENFEKKSLNFITISSDILAKLPNWLLKTQFLKNSKINYSNRQCSIWI